MRPKKMTPQELARKMVKVKRVGEDGWTARVMNAPREKDATRFSFVDFGERAIALTLARLIRGATRDAFALDLESGTMKLRGRRGRGGVERPTAGRPDCGHRVSRSKRELLKAKQRRRMTPWEMAQNMVKMEKMARFGWSVRVANAPREEEATRFRFMDFLRKNEAIAIGQLVRQALVNALALASGDTTRPPEEEQNEGGWLVTADRYFSEIIRTEESV